MTLTELPEKRRTRASGGDLAYVDSGDPDAPPILLLHGFPNSSFMWRDLIPLLDPWMRVIAPDLLGCGDSDRSTDQPLHIRAQAGYVRELLDALGVERLAVIGHGHGGGIAQLLAIRGSVDALALIGSAAFDAWPSERMRRLQRVPPRDERPALVRAAMRYALDRGIADPRRRTAELLDGYLGPWDKDDGARAFFRSLRAADGLGLAGLRSDLGALECPVFLLWGEDDPFIGVEVAERLCDAIPSATLAVIPGCSHYVTEDAPETVLPLLYEWLRARYLRRPHAHADAGPILVHLERPEHHDVD